MSTFKATRSFAERCSESRRVRAKYPDHVPIVCEKDPLDRGGVPDIDKRKFLVPVGATVGQFMQVLRGRIRVPPSQALYVLIRSTMPPTAARMGDMYEDHQDSDGFLYVMYAAENTFG